MAQWDEVTLRRESNWAGQVQGLIHDVPTVNELIERIIQEAKTLIQDRLQNALR